MGVKTLLTLLWLIFLMLRPSENVVALTVPHVVLLSLILATWNCWKWVKISIWCSRITFCQFSLDDFLHVRFELIYPWFSFLNRSFLRQVLGTEMSVLAFNCQIISLSAIDLFASLSLSERLFPGLLWWDNFRVIQVYFVNTIVELSSIKLSIYQLSDLIVAYEITAIMLSD